jgi:ribulose-5-phosphate 4-epimerase/fuculose-1-phosphate aldolase
MQSLVQRESSGVARGSAIPSYITSAEEWARRVDLAAAYRYSAIKGWDELTFAHLSARVPGTSEQFLMHSAELLFEEVTASNLHKLNAAGEHVVASSEPAHRFAFPFHKGIYDAFPEAQCIIHLHTRFGTAVAFQQGGLEPGNQYSLWLGPVGYHEYEGFLSTPEEGKRLASAFGKGQIVIQKGHGFVLWGKSVQEAVMLAIILDRACETQILARFGGAAHYQVSDSCKVQCADEGWRIVLDGTCSFNEMTWQAIHRKVARDLPGYDA